MKKVISILLCAVIIIAVVPLNTFAEEADNIPVITKQPQDIIMSHDDTKYGRAVTVDISAYIPNGDDVYYQVYMIYDDKEINVSNDELTITPSSKDCTYFVRVYDINSFGCYIDSETFTISHAKPSFKESCSETSVVIMYGLMMLSFFGTGLLLSPILSPIGLVAAIYEFIKNRVL